MDSGKVSPRIAAFAATLTQGCAGLRELVKGQNWQGQELCFGVVPHTLPAPCIRRTAQLLTPSRPLACACMEAKQEIAWLGLVLKLWLMLFVHWQQSPCVAAYSIACIPVDLLDLKRPVLAPETT